MAFYIRRAWGVCQRTARRVPLERLVEDGEIPGLLVERSEADEPHPQKYQRPIPPDRVIRRPAPPYSSINTTIRQGTLGNPETGEALLNFAAVSAVQSVTILVEDQAANGFGRGGFGAGPFGQ